MIAEAAAALALVLEVMDEHPDLAKNLVERIQGLFDAGKKVPPDNIEAQRAMASGMAAARANAVQEYERRRKKAAGT